MSVEFFLFSFVVEKLQSVAGGLCVPPAYRLGSWGSGQLSVKARTFWLVDRQGETKPQISWYLVQFSIRVLPVLPLKVLTEQEAVANRGWSLPETDSHCAWPSAVPAQSLSPPLTLLLYLHFSIFKMGDIISDVWCHIWGYLYMSSLAFFILSELFVNGIFSIHYKWCHVSACNAWYVAMGNKWYKVACFVGTLSV